MLDKLNIKLSREAYEQILNEGDVDSNLINIIVLFYFYLNIIHFDK